MAELFEFVWLRGEEEIVDPVVFEDGEDSFEKGWIGEHGLGGMEVDGR